MPDDPRPPFPASESERASIRALKNWLLSMPGENAFDDQINRLRIADAIARVTSASDGLVRAADAKVVRGRAG